jgi:hypothetical protein
MVGGCQWGTGNIEQPGTLTSSNFLGHTSGYVGSTTSLPSSNLLANFQTVASGTIGNVTLDATGGTLTFASGNNYSNVYIAIEDGNGTPRWAVFYIPTIDAATGYVLSAQYLQCQTNVNNTCTQISDFSTNLLSSLSAIEVWGVATAAPLPGALALFAGGRGLIGLAARKKRKTARLAV